MLFLGFSNPSIGATFNWEVEGDFAEGGGSVPSLKVSPAVPSSYGTGFCVNAYTVEEQLSFTYYAMASAKPNADFNNSSDWSNTYCVGPGQTSVSLTGISALNDGVTEGTEDIYVCIQTWDDSEFATNGDFISPASSYDEADTSNGYPYCWLADVTEIVLPTVDFNLTTDSTTEDMGSATVQVDLSAQSTSAITVDYAVTGTATGSGTDYTLANGTLTIPANTSSANITIGSIKDDTIVEGNETVIITLSNPSGATLGSDNVHTFTITDNDAASVDFNVTSSSGAESVSSATLQVDTSAQSTSAITVDYAVTGTATGSGTDYTLANGTLTIPANSSSANITIGSIVDDALVEGNETVIITLSNPSGATLGSDTVHTYTITDNDAASVDFNVTSSSGAESVSSATLQVDTSAQSTSAITVDYAVTGTATGSGTDYTLANGTLTIPANSSSANITIGSIVDDNTYEGDETVIVTLSNPSGATLGSDTVHTYTITENETIPTLSIADVSNAEGAFGVNVQPNLAVTLSHPSSRSVSFNWATQDGTATNADSDYDTDSGTLYISAGATSVNVSPVIFGDDAYENDENFSIILSSPSNATIADGTGVVTITNDDSQPTISVTLNGMAVEGGGNATLRVAPDVVAGVNISFSYTTSDGSATAGSEYTTTSGSATITAGSSDVDIQVPLTDNAIDNSNTDFTFTISSPTNANIGTASETVTILDDEGVVSIGDISVNETDSTATFTVTVQGPIMSSSVDVDFTTVDGSATAGADYVTKSGTLQFTSSDAAPFTNAETQTITVTLSDDAIVEGTENFDISLSNIVSAGSLVMPDNTGRATITDNDAASVDFNVTSSSGAESVSSATLQVDTSAQSTSAITVDYAVTGTATGSGTDYTLANGTLTIPANSSSANITIGSIVDDALVEGNETVIIPVEPIWGHAGSIRSILTPSQIMMQLVLTLM